MTQKLIALMCIGLLISASAYAATNRIVPTAYSTIQAALDAADDGDTITLTDSGSYNEYLSVNKHDLKIVATAGQSPKITNPVDGATTPTVIFKANAGGTQVGSLNGGRIYIQYHKMPSGTALPNAMLRFLHTTNTLVTLENVTVQGVADPSTAGANYGTSLARHDVAIPNRVTMRYVDVQCSRSATVNQADGCNGLVIGGYNKALKTINADGTTGPGPVWNWDHVRFYGFSYGGVCLNYANMEFNASNCDFNGISQLGLRQAYSGSRPNGIVFQNGVFSAPVTCRFERSLFVGGIGNAVLNFLSNGSSITLSRCVSMSKFNYGSTALYGNLMLNVISGGTDMANADPTKPVRMTVDHCDIIDQSVNGTYQTAIVRSTTAPSGGTNAYYTTNSLTVTNSNIYSTINAPVNIMIQGTGESFTFDHCNLYTLGSKDNVGYTPGPGCISFDPMYYDLAAGDFRYNNNTLKTAASDGGPVGVNAGYGDVVAGIVPGIDGVINRAHGWTTLK